MTGKKSIRERFTDKEEWIMTNNEMENRTILFQGKEIDVDDEPGGLA